MDAIKHAVGRAGHWLNAYSRPRPDTTGNLNRDSFFQAAFNGAVDGLYVFGPFGAAFTAGAGALGVGIEHLDQKHGAWLGPVAGAAVGAGLAVGLGALVFGGAPVLLLATGALLGGYETLKGSAASRVRDSGNAAMLTALFMPGPARLSGGLAGMVAAHVHSKTGKALVGATVGAGAGVAVSLLAAGPGALLPALVSGAVAGAVGPFFGPRYSQFFRNLAADFGKPVQKLWSRLHDGHPTGVKPRYFQLVGTVPACFFKEGVKALVLSHGSIPDAVIGGIKEATRQVHVVMEQKMPSSPAPQVAPAARS